MKIIKHPILFYLFAALANLLAFAQGLDRRNFPAGFLFGAASSAYQYEGELFQHDRGYSIWDTFTLMHPEKIADHSNGDVAEDFYHRFKEDIALMKEIGLESFRFSLSWPRILPKGKVSWGVNQKGIDFYNSLIDDLLYNGIQPFVTLFHWDLPQALEDEYMGFLSSNISVDYRDYVELCFKEFGDRVKYWITFNEPNLMSSHGYAKGTKAPGRCSNYIGNCSAGNSGTEPYIVTHNLLIAHAVAVSLYREKYKTSQKGEIGIVIECFWYLPKFPTLESKMAALRALDFEFGWIGHPITYGDYPETMRRIVGERLPKFTEEESKMLKGSIDFLGLNYYSARYAQDSTYPPSFNFSYSSDSHVYLTTEKDGVQLGPSTALDWLYVYPKGLQDLLQYLKTYYNNPPIYITENGYPDPNSKSISIKEALNDSLRINYHTQHLYYLLKAMKAGVNVKGYYVWTFLDDFEWEDGFTIRFGLTYVDFKDGLHRYFKNSAMWLKDFLRNKTVINKVSSLLYSH